MPEKGLLTHDYVVVRELVDLGPLRTTEGNWKAEKTPCPSLFYQKCYKGKGGMLFPHLAGQFCVVSVLILPLTTELAFFHLRKASPG